MALSHEGNTSLAFDTNVLRESGKDYAKIATELRKMAKKLNCCLDELTSTGWTTPAGTAFSKMVDANWEKNIEKYADLLDTLKDIMNEAAKEYDSLVSNYIDRTRL